jgi:hypothetical protein
MWFCHVNKEKVSKAGNAEMTTTPQKFSSFAVFLCMQGLENKFYCCFLKY